MENLHRRMETDDLPYTDYFFNKGLSRELKDYATPGTQPQLWAKERMERELSGSGPMTGGRMDLCTFYDPNFTKVAPRAMDPAQLKRTGEVVDRRYYLKKLTKPLASVLDLALGEGETVRRLTARRNRVIVHHTGRLGLGRFGALMVPAKTAI
jgi:hypothetical protein